MGTPARLSFDRVRLRDGLPAIVGPGPARNLQRPEDHGLVAAYKSNPTLSFREIYAETRIAETEIAQYRHKT